MAVNVGARCLAEGTTLFKTIDELTSGQGIPAEKLTVELTEDALIDTARPPSQSSSVAIRSSMRRIGTSSASGASQSARPSTIGSGKF